MLKKSKCKARIDKFAKDALNEIEKADKALRNREVLTLNLAKVKKDLKSIMFDDHRHL